MTVKIIVDSLADIPARVAQELGITVIPINVLFGTQVFRDGIDLTTDQFYEKLTQGKIFPTTAVPPLGTFIETYDKVAEEASEILVITLSSKLSATYEAALQATKQTKRKSRIEVIDSRLVSMAEGLVVIATAKAVKAGASFDEAVNLTRKNMGRADVRMAFDTLEYLKRGGRIGRARAFLGSVLRVNPVLTLKDGEVFPVCRERSRAKATEHLYNFAMCFSNIEEMAVEDATTGDEADKLVERLSAKFPKERIYRSKVSPVLGAHVGPHVLSVSVLGDK
ncbi:MAG: DegV family protein [Chloroflexi bacterium]|nr:DegV family protein [Chloroflexota bacterium]